MLGQTPGLLCFHGWVDAKRAKGSRSGQDVASSLRRANANFEMFTYRLNRNRGAEVAGANPIPSGIGFERETLVMGFSAKQTLALRGNLDSRYRGLQPRRPVVSKEGQSEHRSDILLGGS